MGEVTDYLATLHGADAEAVRHVYSVAREVAPDATEGRSYAMPALLLHGKGYAAVMVAKKHLSLFPFSGRVLAQFADRLGDFDWAKGTLRFTADHPVPDGLLRDIFTARIAEIEAKTGTRPASD
jgi:uncharacterized protein YdhG (YjbR/CyaY superfamily)